MRKSLLHLLLIVAIILLSGKAYSQEAADLFIGIRAGGSFSTTDVQGNWRFVGMMDLGTGANSIDYFYGNISVNNLGQVTSGNLRMNYGSSGTFTGGTMSIASDGRLNGSIIINNSINYTLLRGKMDISKNKAITLYTNNSAFFLLVLYRDTGQVFSCSDLAGAPWRYAGIAINATQLRSFTVEGSITFTTGGMASGTWKNSLGSIENISSSNNLCPNAAGIFEGWVETDAGTSIVFKNGILNGNDAVLGFSEDGPDDFEGMMILVKDLPAYSPIDSDFYDIFDFFNFRIADNDASASYGNITLVDSGSVSPTPQSGTWTNTEGESGTISGGFFNVPKDGMLENVSNYEVNYSAFWPNYLMTMFTATGKSTPINIDDSTYDVSGTWRMTQTGSSKTCPDHLGYDDGVYEYVITQNGNQVTVAADDGGRVYTGTMNGTTVILRSSQWIEDGYPWNEVATCTFSSNSTCSCNVISTWTDGIETCQTSAQASGIRTSTPNPNPNPDGGGGGGGGGGGCFIISAGGQFQAQQILVGLFGISFLAILASTFFRKRKR
jgi:hypothetical protein